jgi:hypothetical protein
MLLTEVIVGKWAQGALGVSNYPKASGTRDNQYRFCDSLVNQPENPSIFAIPHANQAYPAYVITYTGATPPPPPAFFLLACFSTVFFAVFLLLSPVYVLHLPHTLLV